VTLLSAVPRALPGETAPALTHGFLVVPSGWQRGDAAVVLLPAHLPGDPLDQRLSEALLAEGAATLELDTVGARGASTDDSAVVPATPAPALLPDLFGALAALRRHLDPGLVVVVARDAAGEAALLAADPAETPRRLDAGAAGFAAGIAVSQSGLLAVPGAAPAAAEGWARRAPALCEAVAWAVAGTAEAGAASLRLAARCAASLLAPPVAATAVAARQGAQAR
jgi:hypothetical protein